MYSICPRQRQRQCQRQWDNPAVNWYRLAVPDLFPRLTHADSRTALLVADESWTYAELAGAALEHVALLERVGVERGDRVAVWAQPDLSTAAAMIGNAAAGVATVPLNPKLGLSELRHIFADSEPKLAFCVEGGEVPHEITGVPSLRAAYMPDPASLPRTSGRRYTRADSIHLGHHRPCLLYTSPSPRNP